MEKLKFCGGFLIIWGLLSIFWDIYTRGFFNFGWIWLCTIVTLLTGYAFIKKNSNVLLTSFAVSVVWELFWIIDNIYFIIMKKSIFGVIDYIFEPTTNLFKVLISSYHIFLIPFWIYGIKEIKMEKENNYPCVIIFVIFLAIISFFLGNKYENQNCIFEPCIKQINYFYFYEITWIVVAIIVGIIFSNLIKKISPIIKKNNFIVNASFLIAGILFAATLFTYHLMPHIDCEVIDCKDCGVEASCKYMYVEDNEEPYGVVGIKFFGEDKECQVYRTINKNVFKDSILIKNNLVKEFSFPLQKEDSVLEVEVRCR